MKRTKYPWEMVKKEHGRLVATKQEDNGWNELSAEGFYSRAPWKKLRDAYRTANPLCSECKKNGKRVPMEAVDHILSTTDFPELALDWDNLQSLCGKCHAKKTGQDTAARAGKLVKYVDHYIQECYEGADPIPVSYNGQKFIVRN